MLFNPEFSEPQSASASSNASNIMKPAAATTATVPRKSSLTDSYRMFSAASPSPTRSMIKEANDHLQLLHQRVMELEKTVQEQAEALIKKDELMQMKLRELADLKDSHIAELRRSLETCEQKIKKLEQHNRDKDLQMDLLNQKCLCVEELDAFVPTLEKLLTSLKKIPSKHSIVNNSGGVPGTANHIAHYHHHHTAAKVGSRTRKIPVRKFRDPHQNVPQLGQPDEVPSSILIPSSIGNYHMDGICQVNEQPPTGNPVGQAMADLRIGRSFNINSNFSMSEDDEENDKYS